MSWHSGEIEKYDYGYKSGTCYPFMGEKKWQTWSKTFSPLAKSEKILDAGCGPGLTVLAGLIDGYDMWGTDISPYLLEVIWPVRGLQHRCQLAFVDEMPFEDKEFGIILCLGVLEHIPEEGIMPSLKELKRVLKPNGLLCLHIGLKPYPTKLLGKELHVTIKPREWWKTQLTEVGFSLMETPKMVPKVDLGLVGSYQ